MFYGHTHFVLVERQRHFSYSFCHCSLMRRIFLTAFFSCCVAAARCALTSSSTLCLRLWFRLSLSIDSASVVGHSHSQHDVRQPKRWTNSGEEQSSSGAVEQSRPYVTYMSAIIENVISYYRVVPQVMKDGAWQNAALTAYIILCYFNICTVPPTTQYCHIMSISVNLQTLLLCTQITHSCFIFQHWST